MLEHRIFKKEMATVDVTKTYLTQLMFNIVHICDYFYTDRCR